MGKIGPIRAFDFYELEFPSPPGDDQGDDFASDAGILVSLITEAAAEQTKGDRTRCPSEEERRREPRSSHVMPVAVFLMEDHETSVFVGFTRDVSASGMGLVTTRALPLRDLALVVGDPGEPFAVGAKCLYSREFGLGCYQSGMSISAPLRGAEYAPLLQYFACLTMTIGDG